MRTSPAESSHFLSFPARARRSSRVRRGAAFWACVLVLSLGAAEVSAQTASPSASAALEQELEPEEAQRASAIARRTMSPFCPGRTLADCPSQYAAEWRQDIRQMVAEGRTPEEIQAEFARRAGGDLSGIPHRDSSYWVPLSWGLVATAVLFFIFYRLLRRGRSSQLEASPAEDSGALEATSPLEGAARVDEARLLAELAEEAGDDDED